MEEIEEDDELGVRYVLCDMPGRRHIQGMKNANSTYGCGYCKQAAKTRGGVHWPFVAVKAEYRTTEQSRYFAR